MNPLDFTSLGGTIVVVVVFVWYLGKRDLKFWGHISELTKILNNHLAETARVLAKLDGNINGLRDDIQRWRTNKSRGQADSPPGEEEK